MSGECGDRRPAGVFHPGTFLAEEVWYRGRLSLSRIPAATPDAIIRADLAHLALLLGAALGTLGLGLTIGWGLGRRRR